MPTLTWTGKDKVVNHHHDVPLRVLQREYTHPAPAGTPANSTDNRIIHGDNLEALKSLLPEFEGRVNCIYIDPPYNTGKEGWVYNDAMNDPRIKKWLGQVVGKEGEDLTRHDKWLCMMYPRLKLLYRLLAKDGVIFISIDDNEQANLKLIMDEIFGARNIIGSMVWKNATDNNPTRIVPEHEYVLCYSRKSDAVEKIWKSASIASKEKLLEVEHHILETAKDQKDRERILKEWLKENKPYIWPFQDYKFIDEHGIYTGIRGVHNPGKEGYRYDVLHNITNKPCKEPLMGYRFPEETMKELLSDGRIIFGVDESKIIELKVYLTDYQAKLSSVYELDGRAGTNEIKDIFPESRRSFDFPKVSQLVQDLISFAAGKDALVLDSFAGSGTTAHAVLKLNAQDGGNRRFILCEMMDYAETITAERVRRVMAGYGEGNKTTAGLGGAFSYYTVGEPLFLPDDNLNEAVGVQVIRDYVAYTENIPQESRTTTDNPVSPYLLGQTPDAAWLFHYEPDRATLLDMDFLGSLQFGGKRPALVVVYADACLLSPEFLQRHGLVFKKIPRDITRL